jgi:hypothetical protein
MPVRTQSLAERHADDTRFNVLKRRLIDEWTGRSPGEGNAPDILEETDRQGRVVRVVVTWDEWADLDAQTRSEIIVEALQSAKGDEAVLDLALAMGLTVVEAARFRH